MLLLRATREATVTHRKRKGCLPSPTHQQERNLTQPVAAVSSASLVFSPASLSGTHAATGASFAATLDKALGEVSQAQATAHATAKAEVLGVPGASLETALVASMRAHVEWTAAVAVRNGVVNAANTIMNMQV